MPVSAAFRSVHLSLGAALLALSALLAPHSASASISYCRTDPKVYLSDGSVVTMTAQMNVPARDVQRITYTVHIPTGSSVVQIVYTGHEFKSKEALAIYHDATPGTYDTDTVVAASNSTAVTAQTTAVNEVSGLLGSGTASGYSFQNLVVRIAG